MRQPLSSCSAAREIAHATGLPAISISNKTRPPSHRGLVTDLILLTVHREPSHGMLRRIQYAVFGMATEADILLRVENIAGWQKLPVSDCEAIAMQGIVHIGPILEDTIPPVLSITYTKGGEPAFCRFWRYSLALSFCSRRIHQGRTSAIAVKCSAAAVTTNAGPGGIMKRNPNTGTQRSHRANRRSHRRVAGPAQLPIQAPSAEGGSRGSTQLMQRYKAIKMIG